MTQGVIGTSDTRTVRPMQQHKKHPQHKEHQALHRSNAITLRAIVGMNQQNLSSIPPGLIKLLSIRNSCLIDVLLHKIHCASKGHHKQAINDLKNQPQGISLDPGPQTNSW